MFIVQRSIVVDRFSAKTKFRFRRRHVRSEKTNQFNVSLGFFLLYQSLIGLGLEQKDAQIFLVGHDEKSIKDRINSLRYVRVRRGKQNPIRAFFTYGSVPDASLAPWYRPPPHFDYRFIYPDGLISKSNVVFPPWFRLVKTAAIS